MMAQQQGALRLPRKSLFVRANDQGIQFIQERIEGIVLAGLINFFGEGISPVCSASVCPFPKLVHEIGILADLTQVLRQSEF